MDLRCNKTNCKHNCKCACTASEIHIAKNTDCQTYDKDFAKDQKNAKNVSKDMFEIAPEVAEFSHKDNTCVDCHAKCLFNKNGKCNANGITVLEDSEKGFCGTYIEE